MTKPVSNVSIIEQTSTDGSVTRRFGFESFVSVGKLFSAGRGCPGDTGPTNRVVIGDILGDTKPVGWLRGQRGWQKQPWSCRCTVVLLFNPVSFPIQ